MKELHALSPEAKEYLCHHLNNALVGVITGIEIERYDIVKESAKHLAEDIKKICI